ncbi:MAG: Rrf2 family transcriptional regulator [Cyanosarcina radialis HA8281-LM2]|nr:Rrf2 family transcriptional regulator [Cyanosarcina radialis HA8281-LM2]
MILRLFYRNTVVFSLSAFSDSFRQTIPERYLEQIFIVLRRGGIVQSQRGAKGGIFESPRTCKTRSILKVPK